MIVIIASVLDRKHVVPRVLRHCKSYVQSDISIPCCPALQCHILERIGQSLFRRNGSTGDSQTLNPKRIQQGLSHETSGWHNGRLANATSFLAGNLRQLVGITNLSPTAQELMEDTQSFKRTRIPQLATRFSALGAKSPPISGPSWAKTKLVTKRLEFCQTKNGANRMFLGSETPFSAKVPFLLLLWLDQGSSHIARAVSRHCEK